MIDVGAGTMDVLYYDSESGAHYKSVSRSSIIDLAEKINNISGNLIITGNEMGGGNLSNILRERIKRDKVIMTHAAASTINHDHEKVRSMGVGIVTEEDAYEIAGDGSYTSLETSDLNMEKLRSIMKGIGVPFSFDVVGICAQDHGVPPYGVSHLDFRHNIFKESLNQKPFPYSLLYRDDEVPPVMSRLTSIVKDAKKIPSKELYIMDSGMAAILGATLDLEALDRERIIVLDVATSHTVGAAMKGVEIAGFFEYHTSDITLNRIETLIIDLAEGKLNHAKILEEGGHGAYIREKLGYDTIDLILATGPKRSIILGSTLPIKMGAPIGDNMMTGTAGLLEAIRLRKGLASFSRII